MANPVETIRAKLAQTVLIADDSPTMVRTLSEILRRKGYNTVTAADGVEALRQLEEKPIDLVLTDIRMPGMDGLTLLEKIHTRMPDIPVVLLTAWPSVEATVRALRLGARDFLTKPTSTTELLRVVENQLRLRRFWVEECDKSGLANKRIRQYLTQLRGTAGSPLEVLLPVLQTLANVLDAREHETQSHSARVSAYAAHLAEQLGASSGEQEIIRAAGLMHDIGKMGVPDSILLKAGPLTPEEWEVMKQHPQIGYDMLKDVPGLRPAAEIVLAHHERWDGKGYPRGLKGEAIPFGARVFALVDTMDAMLSNRPYRKALTYSMVRKQVEIHRGTQFDPEVAEVFLQIPEQQWHEVIAERCPNLARCTLEHSAIQPGLPQPAAAPSR